MKHLQSSLSDTRSKNRLSARAYLLATHILVLTFICSAATQSARAEYAFQVLYEFPHSGTGPSSPTRGRLLQDNDGNFYGTSRGGGSNVNGFGTVFKMTPGGVVTPLISFDGTNGIGPSGGLLLANDGMLYGTTGLGGTNAPNCMGYLCGYGTVFRITTNGVFTSLFSFNVTNGQSPGGLLAQGSDGNIYGVTGSGGTNNLGTIFRVTPDGTVTSLLSFNGTNGSGPGFGLVQGSDGELYGTMSHGGGAVFKLTTNGVLTTLVSFNGTNGSQPTGLALGSDGNFYGATYSGGAFGNGTVFKLTPDGTLNTLASFDGTNGRAPYSGVTEGADGKFYGVTAYGTVNTNSAEGEVGTVYSVTTNGVLTVVARFDGTNGQNPFAELTLAHDGNLYGVTGEIAFSQSLDGNTGIFFRLAQVPQVTSITRLNSDVELTWSSFTNGIYRVEYKPSLTATNWIALVPDVTATNNSASFTDNTAGDAERYYHVRLLP